MGKNRVVIIDDEPITRMGFREILLNNGYKVVGEAGDGFDAIELCKQKKPDVVLMDIKMGVFDGISAAEIMIKERISDCVILISAYDDKEFFSKAKQAGVINYLIKPVSEKELIPTLEMAIFRCDEIRKMKEKIITMEKTVTDQKLIEKAKIYLSKAYKITEREAYDRIRKLSMDKQCSKGIIAEKILSQDVSRENIEKAKKYLMKTHNISDKNAYKKMKNMGANRNISMSEVALHILDQYGE